MSQSDLSRWETPLHTNTVATYVSPSSEDSRESAGASLAEKEHRVDMGKLSASSQIVYNGARQ